MNQNVRFNKKRGGFRGHRGGGGGRGGNRGWGRGSYNNYYDSWNENGGGSRGNFRGRGGNRFQDGKPWQKRPKPEAPTQRLSEEDIGVTEYISKHDGFNGIIKSRYSDFQVSEVNEQGEIAKLTNCEPPNPPREETVDEDEDLLLNKYNVEILPMETWDKLNSLAVKTDKSAEIVEIDMTGASKEDRTRIHDAVKKAFGDAIVGSTVTEGDKKFVRFEKYRKGVRIDTRVKWVWPGEYVYFIVHKENCDTMDAASRIAERLGSHVKPSVLGYAGTKDRRAKTSQWFSARKVDPRKLHNAARSLPDLALGNYSFKAQPLKLGMLKGNRFRIALRNVTADDAIVDAACAQLRDNGFINYYGLQRFGTRVDTPTYDIGLKLLQSNYKEAIDAILEPCSGPLHRALSAYKRDGAPAALCLLPRGGRARPEPRLLKALAAHPNDLLGALNKLARNTRLLYVHSYQSLIWNRAVSARLQQFGAVPAVGDLVPLARVDVQEELDLDESDSEDTLDDSKEDNNSTEQKETDSNAEDYTDSAADEQTAKSKREKNIDEPKPKVPVKVLTQEDVDSGKYTIFDIVMPLPGYNVDYPPNMRQFYEDQLAKDGLTMHLRHRVKNYSMSGAYRHVSVRPLETSWRSVTYTAPYADLILSDLDELQGKTTTGAIPDGKYKALLLTLTLPASCYATMALRELMRVDTSSDKQALQNNYHKRKRDSQGDRESESDEKRMKEGDGDSARNGEDEDVAMDEKNDNDE